MTPDPFPTLNHPGREARIVKAILHATMHDPEEGEERSRIQLQSIDSLRFPFADFFEKGLAILENETEGWQSPTLFLCAGETKEIEAIHASWKQEVNDLFQSILNGEGVTDMEVDTSLATPTTAHLLHSYIKHIHREGRVLFPVGGLWEMGKGLSLMIFYGTSGPDVDISKRIDVVANYWMNVERPELWGRLCLTKGFQYQRLQSRTVVTSFNHPVTNDWCLLFEGGTVLTLDAEGQHYVLPFDRQFDQGLNGVEMGAMLRNSIYYTGVYYEPESVYMDWHNLLLYLLATRYADELSLPTIEKVLDTFHAFIASEICFSTSAEPLVEKEMGLKVFQRNLAEVASYLCGGEEAGITKNLLFSLRQNFAFVPHLDALLAEVLTDYAALRFKAPLRFEQRDWDARLRQLRTGATAHELGLAMEELAERFIQMVPGLEVTGKRNRGDREEVDLYCCNTSYHSLLWETGALILVECKNQKAKVSAQHVRNVASLMDAKGIRCSMIFSYAGFTADAALEVQHQAERSRMVLAIELEDLQRVSNEFTPLQLIEEKVRTLDQWVSDELGHFGLT